MKEQDEGIWGRSLWMDVQKRTSVKNFALHVNAHQIAPITQESVNNLLDKITRPIDVSQLFIVPSHPCAVYNGFIERKRKEAMKVGLEAIDGPNSMDSSSPRLI